MALGAGDVANFKTLQRAMLNRDCALVECTDAVTGNPVAVLCAMSADPHGNVTMTPLARLFDGNPYEQVRPPEDPGATASCPKA